MSTQPVAIETCPQCATQLAPTMKACPVCGRLVHGDTLAALAQAAKEATERGDLSAAMGSWREALDLLPARSKQYQVIAAKIGELGRNLPSGAATSPASASAAGQKSGPLRAAAGLGAIGLMLWKFKALLFGLTKGTTVLSMLLSLGVYWTAWGWQFALGIVLSIYVHEMGHVIAMHRYGFKATAPMFVPGIGALIRLKQHVVNPRENADIGLAGPIYGLGAALVSLVAWGATQQPIFAGIAGVGAWINVLNLIPIGSLDGGRGFSAMSRWQKFIAAATAGAACAATSDGLLLIVALVCFGRAVGDKSEAQGYRKATAIYCLLILALAAVATVRSQTGLDN